MYKKILVPLDGSDLAEKVLPHAEKLARCADAEIILIRVPEYAYETEPIITAPIRHAPLPLRDEREEALRETKRYLNRVRNDLIKHGYRVSTAIREGGSAEAIIRFAHEADVDLIAISTHGRTGWSRAVFGSMGEEVLHGSGKPILLIRPQL